MSKSLNKCMIIGHLGEDPSLRHTQSGTAVVNLSIATNHRIKRGDQWEDAVSWHRAVAWGKTAEACGEYLNKGSQVYLEGRLETKSWQDDSGVKRWVTEIICSEVIFLSSQGQKSDRPPSPPNEGQDQRQSGGSGDGDQAGEYDASEEDLNVPF